MGAIIPAVAKVGGAIAGGSIGGGVAKVAGSKLFQVAAGGLASKALSGSASLPDVAPAAKSETVQTQSSAASALRAKKRKGIAATILSDQGGKNTLG